MINIEIDEKYKEHLELIKEVIPELDGSQITSDNRAVEVLIESFIAFLQEQANMEHEHIHDENCNH